MFLKKATLSKLMIFMVAISLLISFASPVLAQNYGLPNRPLRDIIGDAINWLLSVSAVIAILFIIIGGIYYMTALGTQDQMEQAKRIITYAIWGLLMIGASYAIIKTIDKILRG